MDFSDAANPLYKRNVREYVSDLAAPALRPQVVDFLYTPEPCVTDWVFVMCQADFIAGDGTYFNHWVPAVTEQCVGKELFTSLEEAQAASFEVRDAEIRLQYAAAETEEGDDQMIAAMLSDMRHRLEHLNAFKAFAKRCHDHGLHPIEVPADGNCMAWSLKVHREGDYFAEKVDPSKDMKGVDRIRRELSHAWKLGRDSVVLQHLFHHMYVADAEPAADASPTRAVAIKLQAPATPKRRRSCFPGPVDLLTPPEKPKAPRRINECTRAPAWPRPLQHSPTLRTRSPQPKKKKRAAAGEPVPAPGADADAEIADADVEPDVAEAPAEAAPGTLKTTKKRTRCGRRREKTPKELRMEKLKLYLASIGIDFLVWQERRWRMAGSKKAGICPDGKYTEFQLKLMGEAPLKISCTCCKQLLDSQGFNPEMIDAMDLDAELGGERGPGDVANAANDLIENQAESGDEAEDKDQGKDPENMKNMSDLEWEALVRKWSPHLQVRSKMLKDHTEPL